MLQNPAKILYSVPKQYLLGGTCLARCNITNQQNAGIFTYTGRKVIIKRAFSDNRLKDTKTSVIREYELTSYANEIIELTIAKNRSNISPFVFIRIDGKPYTNKNLNALWHDAEEKTGIKIKLYNAVRHSLGCQLLDLGYEMDLVRQLLGHTKTEMTMRYAERSNPTITKALKMRDEK